MKEKYLLSIKADDRPGLVSQITAILNRKQLDIESISAAKTDIHSVVLITIELFISERAVEPLLLRIENIIEVDTACAVKASEVVNHRVAFFKLSKKVLETPQAAAIQRSGATIVNLYPNAILISKAGCEADIQNLYNQLEGAHLIGFIQSGSITDTSLINNDEYRVIDKDDDRISLLAA